MSELVGNIATSTEERAIRLLGSGVNPAQAAAALGLTEGRISQLLSDPIFASKIAELRFQNLQSHNERDSKYDSIEDKLLDSLEDLLPLMIRPQEILRAISVINNAKRRGVSAPDSVIQQQTIVNLSMPTQIIQKFTTNINNQVIKAGERDLVTIQSSTLMDKIKNSKPTDASNESNESERIRAIEHNTTT